MLSPFFKTLFIVLLSIVFFIPADGQGHQEIDSLTNILKTAKEDTNKVKLLNRLSREVTSNDPQLGSKYATEALALSLKLKWVKGEVESNYRIGYGYACQSNFSEALNYFLRSIKIIDLNPENRNRCADIYVEIGSVYKHMGDYENALKYSLLARQFFLEFDKNSTDGMGGIGDVYYHQENYPEALKYYTKALEGSHNSSCISMIQVGKVYMMQHNYKMADSILTYAISLSRIKNEERQIGIGLQILARIYLLEVNDNYPLQEDSKTHLKKSLAYAEESESIFKKISANDLIDTYQVLFSISVALKDYVSINKYHELMLSTKDKKFNETSSNQLATLHTKFETEKKDNEIALLSKDKDLQRAEIKKQALLMNSLIGGMALVLVLFFFIYNNYRTKQKLKLENIRNNIAADLHDDIGSTLNSISLFSEVAKQEAGKPIPALEQIGVSARKIIDSMSDIVWTINPENDTFENVIARMRSLAYLLLKAKGIEFIFKADEDLNQLSLPMLTRKNVYLLLKEATNNIVKYSNASRASFHISLENNSIKFVIHDNGIGFDLNNIQTGNGIKNMKRRATEIGGQFVIESSSENGTNIELTFKA